MSRLLAILSAFLVTSMPAWAQDSVPEEALEHAVDESVSQEVHQQAHSSGLPQFNPETWPSQIFWLAISFAILYFVFAKFILPSLTGTIENRANKIQGDIQTAEELSERAEKIRIDYETELKKAAAKASSDMKAIDEEAKAKLAKSLADFRGRYETEVSAVETRLETSKQAALVDMQKLAAEIAAKAAEKIAGIPADQSQADTIVQSLKNKAA